MDDETELESVINIPEQYDPAIKRLSQEISARARNLHALLREMGADNVEISIDGLYITIERETDE